LEVSIPLRLLIHGRTDPCFIDMAEVELVFVKNFTTFNEAEMAQQILRSAGIPAVIRANDVVGVLASTGAKGGHHDLLVFSDDADEARKILLMQEKS